MDIKKSLDINGWAVCKNLFTPSEIDDFRKYALDSRDFKSDLLSHPSLKKILLDERILNLTKEVLGNDEIYYFGDSTVSINPKKSGFHKDCVDRKDKTGRDWEDTYTVIRLGIYLQDHKKHSGGLCLRDKSHHDISVNKGKIVNVKSEVGDVIIWKLTTTHSANANILRFIPSVSLHPRIARKLPSFVFEPTVRPRIALFLTFGKEDIHSERFIKFLASRQYMVDKWEKIKYSADDIHDARSKGIKIMNPATMLKSVDKKTLNEEYKQIKID